MRRFSYPYIFSCSPNICSPAVSLWYPKRGRGALRRTGYVNLGWKTFVTGLSRADRASESALALTGHTISYPVEQRTATNRAVNTELHWNLPSSLSYRVLTRDECSRSWKGLGLRRACNKDTQTQLDCSAFSHVPGFASLILSITREKMRQFI